MGKHPYDDRRQALIAWLTANGILPEQKVPWDADLTIRTEEDGSRTIVYEACVLNEQGQKQLDDRGESMAVETRTAPLLVDPPEWWQPYEKPTRDQLLEGEEPYTDPSLIPTPAQWIWQWNRQTPAERIERAQRALDDREAAYLCGMMHHTDHIRDLEAQVSRVAQLAERWKHTGDRKNGPRQELLQALSGTATTPEGP